MKQKRIFAVRHGQSEWNVLHEAYPSEEDQYHPRMCKIDCDMTELGKQQSKEAGITLSEQLASFGISSPDLVMVSPLRRALHTASYVLESFSGMAPPKIQICKDCTEVMLVSCDIGSPPAALSNEFPEWDFSHLNGFWWYGGHSPERTWSLMQQEKFREKESDIAERIKSLKACLRAADHATIVVVCHSDTIWWLTSKVNDDGERFGTYTKNAEILDITSHIMEV